MWNRATNLLEYLKKRLAGRWTPGQLIDEYGLDGLEAFVALCALLLPWLSSDEVASRIASAKWKDTVQTWSVWLFWPFLFAFASLFVLRVKRRKVVKEVSQENEQLQGGVQSLVESVDLICNGYLHHFGRDSLGFGSQPNNCERVTLYRHDSDGGFNILGRATLNPTFDGKGKRGRYLDSKGFLAKVWSDGSAFDAEYPDPNSQWDSYVEKCESEGLSKTTVQGMRMRARLLAGVVIRDHHSHPVAILLAESTEPDRYEKEDLLCNLRGQKEFLGSLIDAMPLPDTSIASSKGM